MEGILWAYKPVLTVWSTRWGLSCSPCWSWLHFRLGRNDQGDDNGVLSLELAGKRFWGARWAVCHRACSCVRDKFCSRLCRHNFGWFPNHKHVILLWLISFKGVYSFNFYNGVSGSRIWPEATTDPCWQSEWNVQKQTHHGAVSSLAIPNARLWVQVSHCSGLVEGSRPSPGWTVCRNEESGALFPVLILAFLPAVSPSWTMHMELIRYAALSSASWRDTCLF